MVIKLVIRLLIAIQDQIVIRLLIVLQQLIVIWDQTIDSNSNSNSASTNNSRLNSNLTSNSNLKSNGNSRSKPRFWKRRSYSNEKRTVLMSSRMLSWKHFYSYLISNKQTFSVTAMIFIWINFHLFLNHFLCRYHSHHNHYYPTQIQVRRSTRWY